ncbi:MAG TPA: DedA family protein [Verrucomicrobiae bacterium]|nr:DedA family protein [Verrucomicrobiae bacterium]
MIVEAFNSIIVFITSIISSLGYPGIFLLMVAESAMIPIPSEIIMTFSGFLVATNKLTFLEVVLAGSFGNLIGSIITYYIGIKVGRPIVIKYGKYILFKESHLKFTEKLVEKIGDKLSFIGRLLPGIRTYVSLPLGIAKADFIKFSIYTLLGSLIWNTCLTYIGLRLGRNWESFHKYSTYLDFLAIIIIIGFIIWFIYKIRRSRTKLNKI